MDVGSRHERAGGADGRVARSLPGAASEGLAEARVLGGRDGGGAGASRNGHRAWLASALRARLQGVEAAGWRSATRRQAPARSAPAHVLGRRVLGEMARRSLGRRPCLSSPPRAPAPRPRAATLAVSLTTAPCMSWCASISRPSSRRCARSAARTCRATSSRSCAAICAAASWPMDFCESRARRAARKSSSPFPASAAGRAQAAERGECVGARHIWWTTCCRTSLCASGCSRCRTKFAVCWRCAPRR